MLPLQKWNTFINLKVLAYLKDSLGYFHLELINADKLFAIRPQHYCIFKFDDWPEGVD